ncbi:hypothetical protein N5F23_00570 [Pseudomonas sichuanensis]|uniref:hypothetical protein n=1 Tax=Pseudomonas sichuanensis TaxID=2213015 RepID=UPI0024483ADD|nr:hypothetical protein [Pseudomonas sichuanensis]MDH0730937.1 hypothetical protein [Pseudomonas sichuanensis]MDH1581086.1 hypothetical protein [Pseudomonas sichuanensis]MDH1591053.1 hypothetical protein [Pseudomonas sichuanensis]MDH1596722.1 hypothetical protein [Pseudomonas sichuanensis]
MATNRVMHLEQALAAVFAAAEQQGLDLIQLRRQAIGGLIGNTSWSWVDSEQVPGAIAEIEGAIWLMSPEEVEAR